MHKACPVIWTHGAIATQSVDLHESFSIDQSLSFKEGLTKVPHRRDSALCKFTQKLVSYSFRGRWMFDYGPKEFVRWNIEGRSFRSNRSCSS
jgi:hypothetical protein